MRRREFIAGLTGSAAAWPAAGWTQPRRMPVVGFLRSTGSAGSTYLVAAFRQGLEEAGFIEGQNVTVEYRWGDDRHEWLPAFSADLVARSVDVIVGNTPSSLAAKAATKSIPIVFVTGGDPISEGLVTSLNRPEGNVTGLVFFFGQLGSKRFEIVRQTAKRSVFSADDLTEMEPSGLSPVKLIDFLLAGHSGPAVGLDYLVTSGVFTNRPPQSISELSEERYAALKTSLYLGFDI